MAERIDMIESIETEAPEDASFEFARVEIFGHTKHYGRIREEERLGVKMLRVDVPIDGDPDAKGWRTLYYAASAVFSLALSDRETIIHANKPYAPPSRLILAREADWQDPDDSEETP